MPTDGAATDGPGGQQVRLRVVERLLIPLLVFAGIMAQIRVGIMLLEWTGALEFMAVRPRTLMIVAVALVIGGAATSWWLGKDIAFWAMRVRPLSPEDPLYGEGARRLAAALGRMGGRLGLSWTPETALYVNEHPNAFSVGRRARTSAIVVSSGLLARLSDQELDAVCARELTRLADGSMVTQLLALGQVHALTLFPVRMLALAIATAPRSAVEETPSDTTETILMGVCDLIWTFAGSWPARWHSRLVERRADAAARRLAGPVAVDSLLAGLRARPDPEAAREKFTLPLKLQVTVPRALVWCASHANR